MRYIGLNKIGNGRVTRRTLFSIAVAASLLLCTTAVTLGVRAHSRGDWLRWISKPVPIGVADEYGLTDETSTVWDIIDYNNGIQIARTVHTYHDSIYHQFLRESGFKHFSVEPDDSTLKTALFGFALRSENHPDYGDRHRVVSVAFPWWAIVVVTSIYPLVALVRHVRRPTGSPNSCIRCGYNLIGNASGICPECGRPVDHSRKAAETKKGLEATPRHR